jgi:hypothetical protein
MHEQAMMMFRAIADTRVSMTQTRYGITAPIVLSMKPGRLLRLSVVRAGVSPGRIHDACTLIDAGKGNLIATIAPQLGMWSFEDWPMEFGIVVVPGLGQTIAAAFR